jgi:hypothetical protein
MAVKGTMGEADLFALLYIHYIWSSSGHGASGIINYYVCNAVWFSYERMRTVPYGRLLLALK